MDPNAGVYQLPYNIEAVRRISSGKRGEGDEILEKKSRFKKKGFWEEYKVVGNFIHPCPHDTPGLPCGDEGSVFADQIQQRLRSQLKSS